LIKLSNSPQRFLTEDYLMIPLLLLENLKKMLKNMLKSNKLELSKIYVNLKYPLETEQP